MDTLKSFYAWNLSQWYITIRFLFRKENLTKRESETLLRKYSFVRCGENQMKRKYTSLICTFDLNHAGNRHCLFKIRLLQKYEYINIIF